MNQPIQEQLEELLGYSKQVGTLPTIYLDISQAVEDPETSFGEIGQIIARDSSLSGRLLKIVNSAFYGFSSEIETITHAIAVIGTAQLRDLVLATTVMDKFKGIPQEWLDMEAFWRHSIGCGLSARIIATLAKQRNPERFYTLGILHDLGRLVMIIGAADKMHDILEEVRKTPAPLVEVEKKVLGYDHGDVGRALLEKWNLSPNFQAAVYFSHRPDKDTTGMVDSAILHLSDIVVHSLEMGNSGDPFVPALNDIAWRKCGLSPAMLQQVVSQLDFQMQEIIPKVL